MEDNLQFLEANKYLIRYFYVYKHKSFIRAAENFYVAGTDRNMKYAVTQLEDFYGVQLITVKGNKLEFTEFGEILGEQAGIIFRQNLKINSILNKINLKEVNFGTSPDFHQYYIKPIFDYFQKEHSDTKITLVKTNQLDGTRMLLNREIDFFVGTKPINPHPELEYQIIAEAKILLITLDENKKYFDNIKSLKDLVKYKGAMNDFTDPFYYNFKECEKNAEIELNILFYTSDFKELLDVVKRKVVDYSLVGNYTEIDDLISIDLTHFFKPVNIAFIYRKKELFTKAIDMLIKISEKLKIIPK